MVVSPIIYRLSTILLVQDFTTYFDAWDGHFKRLVTAYFPAKGAEDILDIWKI